MLPLKCLSSDNEGDLVAFSTDEELVDAVAHVAECGDGIFHIFASEIDDDHPVPQTYCTRTSIGHVGIPAAVATWKPFIEGLLSAPRQNGCKCQASTNVRSTADTQQASTTADTAPTPSSSSSSSADWSAAAEGGKQDIGSDGPMTSNCQSATSASGCGGQQDQHTDERAAVDFVANVIHGLSTMLNVTGRLYFQHRLISL